MIRDLHTGKADLVVGRFDAHHHVLLERLAGAVRYVGRVIAIDANPDLQERELIKLQRLTAAIKGALVERGVPMNAAILAAHSGVTIFHVAFAHWVQQNDPTALRRLIDESLQELRSVTAT